MAKQRVRIREITPEEHIAIPFKYVPRPYQRDNMWQPFDDGFKRIVCVWNRRAGKDKSAWNLMIREAIKRPGNYYYVFPTYESGKKAIWDAIDFDGIRFLEHIPEDLIVKRNETLMKIDLRTVDGRESSIQIVGAQDPDRLRGTNPKGIVFSEWSYMNPEAWKVLSPVLAQNEGWAIFVYTPNGMNHGWDTLAQARENPKWFASLLTVQQTRSLTDEALEEEKSLYPEDFFQQEYYCEFIQGASQIFHRIDENLWDGELDPQIGHIYQIGVDLAKYRDWTVITPFDLTTFRAGKQIRFNQIDWNLQKARIEAVALRYFNATVVIDSTGVGDPIAEELDYMGINIIPYKFTFKSRRQLLDNLALLLEQDKIKIADDEGLKDELRSMRWVIRSSVNSDMTRLGMAVADGMTDDRIMSLALSVWEVKSPVSNYSANEFSLYKQTYK